MSNDSASDFCHLHVHYETSTLDGINRIDTLPQHVADLGQTALAQTDHGNMVGSYQFFKSCVSAGVKPIIGIEAYYSILDHGVREKDDDGNNYYHLVLLAKNNVGLKNLFAISSKAFTENMYYKPRCSDALLGEYSEGIIATSACLGSRASRLILSGRKEEAERLILHHKSIFGDDNFLIELQLHEDKNQQDVNRALIEIGRRNNLPLVLTNDCHYTNHNDKQLHEMALAMSTNAKMHYPPWDPERKVEGSSGKTRFSFGDIDVAVAHRDWMWERAQRQGIPYEAIRNTSYVASLIDSDTYYSDIRNRYPEYRNSPNGLSSWDYLEQLSHELLRRKLGGHLPAKYKERLEHENKLLKKMQFDSYLLILKDIVDDAAAIDVPMGPGRGSAAGCLVAYALGITHVDPIEKGLLFSRFLNPGRASRPLLFTPEMKKVIKEREKTSIMPNGHCASECDHSHGNCNHHDH